MFYKDLSFGMCYNAETCCMWYKLELLCSCYK